MPEPEATDPTPKVSQDAVESSILAHLTCDNHQRPISVDELIRDYHDRIVTEDAIANLHRDGLIHRLGDFVFATRAAVRAEEIEW